MKLTLSSGFSSDNSETDASAAAESESDPVNNQESPQETSTAQYISFLECRVFLLDSSQIVSSANFAVVAESVYVIHNHSSKLYESIERKEANRKTQEEKFKLEKEG